MTPFKDEPSYHDKFRAYSNSRYTFVSNSSSQTTSKNSKVTDITVSSVTVSSSGATSAASGVTTASKDNVVTTTTKADMAVSTDDCGVTSGCFKSPNDCENDKCSLIVKWEANNDRITFTLFGRVQLASPYLALGFSKDAEMVK